MFKINLNCTSHIILFEPLNQSNCIIIFYKEHNGHDENELQPLGLPITKMINYCNVIQLVEYWMILRIILEVGNLKIENLITRYDLHNIK